MSGTPLNQATLIDEAIRHFEAVFVNAQLGLAPKPYSMLAREVPVKGKSHNPRFAARLSGVHEWLSEREIGRIKNFGFEILVRRWADALAVDLDDLADDEDNLNLYDDVVGDMADNFEEHKQDLADALIANGFAATEGTAYDGQFFFDSDHQDFPGGPINDNVSTDALDEAGYVALRQKMHAIRKPNGKLAGVRPTHIMVPNALQSTAESIFKERLIGGGDTNRFFNEVEIIVNPRLDAFSTTAWYLFDLSKRLKPLEMPMRQAVRFQRRASEENEPGFERNEAQFGGKGRYGMGYAYYHLAAGSDGTV